MPERPGVSEKQLFAETSALGAYLRKYGTKRTDSDSVFEYNEVVDPVKTLNALSDQGFIFHGSPRKIDNLIPQLAVDKAKESGNRKAIYMTSLSEKAMFYALTGDREEGGTEAHIYVERIDGQPDRKTFHFAVEDKKSIREQGFVYVFSKLQADEFVNNEYISYKALRPIAVIAVKRKDFLLPIAVRR